MALKHIVLYKSVVSEGKELISNWPIKFQETHGFLFLIGQFNINSFPSLIMNLQSTIRSYLYIATSLLIVSAPDSQAYDHNTTMSENDRLLADLGSVGDNVVPHPYQQELPNVVYQPPPADAVRHIFIYYGSVFISHTH